MPSHRLQIRRPRFTLGLALAALAAVPAAAQAAGPTLNGLRLHERRLTLTLDCTSAVEVRRAGRASTAACRDRRARAVLALSAAQHRMLRSGRTLTLAVRVSDAGGATVLPLKLSLPVRGKAVARAASGGYWPTVEAGWDGVQGQCIATDRSDWSGQPGWRQLIIESNSARFGYAYGTPLRWTAWMEYYDVTTGVVNWVQGATVWHTAGGGRGGSAAFNIANRPQFVRPAVQVGGVWNYVYLGTVAGKAVPFGGWCLMPTTA